MVTKDIDWMLRCLWINGKELIYEGYSSIRLDIYFYRFKTILSNLNLQIFR